MHFQWLFTACLVASLVSAPVGSPTNDKRNIEVVDGNDQDVVLERIDSDGMMMQPRVDASRSLGRDNFKSLPFDDESIETLPIGEENGDTLVRCNCTSLARSPNAVRCSRSITMVAASSSTTRPTRARAFK